MKSTKNDRYWTMNLGSLSYLSCIWVASPCYYMWTVENIENGRKSKAPRWTRLKICIFCFVFKKLEAYDFELLAGLEYIFTGNNFRLRWFDNLISAEHQRFCCWDISMFQQVVTYSKRRRYQKKKKQSPRTKAALHWPILRQYSLTSPLKTYENLWFSDVFRGYR